MYIHILPFYNICSLMYFHIKIFVCWWSRKCLTHYSISTVFLVQSRYAYSFSNFSLILCLQYTWNSRIYIKIATWMIVCCPNILCAFTFRHLPKIFKTGVWQKDRTLWTILSFKEFFKVSLMLSLKKSFDQKVVPFNSDCFFRNFRNVWPKDNTVQPILSVKKILVKRQYGSTHIVFFEKFDQKTKWFSQYCLYWKFWPKENMFQPEYCLFRKFWRKDNVIVWSKYLKILSFISINFHWTLF